MSTLGDVTLLRDTYKKLNSTFGKNSNKRIAVLKTVEQAKGGALGNLFGTGTLFGKSLFTGSEVASVIGGTLGDILGLNAKDIYADVIFSYSHRASIKLTDNPVESGVLVNDHRIIEAKTLTIEFGVANDDASPPKKNEALMRGAGLILFGDSPNSQSKVITTYKDLVSTMKNGEPFDIETPVGTYKNMLITNVDISQDAETINVLKGNITFKELLMYEVKQSSKLSKTSGVFKLIEGGLKKTRQYTNEAISLLPTNAQSKLRSVF